MLNSITLETTNNETMASGRLCIKELKTLLLEIWIKHSCALQFNGTNAFGLISLFELSPYEYTISKYVNM